MAGYGQFCPVAKAAEVLDQRWMLLVVRELLAGSVRFNDIHRGVPRMSRTLLSKRLRQLIAGGLVERRDGEDGPVYVLTDAGLQLRPVIAALGEWGVRHIDGPTDEDLDPAFLLWDMHRRVDRHAVPDRQTVVAFTFVDAEPSLRHWWLLIDPDDVEICEDDPGRPADVDIETTLSTFVRVWRGDVGWNDAVRSRELEVTAPSRLRRRIPTWFRLSHFADVARAGT